MEIQGVARRFDRQEKRFSESNVAADPNPSIFEGVLGGLEGDPASLPVA